MANAPYGSGGYQYNNQPSPYMQQSSAGNPASSYGSQGGAQAGPWGQPAPQQGPSPLWSPNQSGGGYTYTGPGSTAAAHPQQQGYAGGGAQTQQGQWGFPTQQQQGGYQYQPPPQQARPQVQPQYQQGPTSWQYPQGTPQGPPPPQSDPYAQWMGQIMAPYNPQQGGYGGYAPPPQQQGPPQRGTSYVPPQGVNTDGYPQPRITQMPQANAMPGWDNTKWNDPNHQTPKYVVGRLLQDIPPRTENMAMAMQRIQAAYPGARQIGPGDINIPGVGSVDILRAAGAGGKGWQWGGGQSAQKFPDNRSQGGSGGGGLGIPPHYDIKTAMGGGDLSSLIAMLMGGPQQNVMTAQAAPAAPKVDPKVAAAAALEKQRADTAAAEAKKAQGPGGVHPSFAYY